jgi:SAM-dependent methyltransferase
MSTIDHERAAVFQDADRQQLQRVFAMNLPPDGLRAVLDAGCGYKLPIDVPREAHLAGIDMSPEAIAKNANLDERIVGDLQTYPLPREEYDAVICWWVLEHVPDRAAALTNLAGSMRPGGLLVIGVPHIFSMKAAVTKLTPHSFHVWVLKNFFGVADAGQPGVEPYPTFLKLDLAPSRLCGFLAELGLTPVYSVTVNSGDEQGLPTWLLRIWNATAAVARACTVGAWNPHSDEYVAIFTKAAR